MRALSLQQPWAELVLQGKKKIETRNWNTKFRGEFFIHASKTIDKTAARHFKINSAALAELTTGAIVGKATLTATKKYKTAAEWKSDNPQHLAAFLSFKKAKYGFILTAVKRLPPKTAKGKLNFFLI